MTADYITNSSSVFNREWLKEDEEPEEIQGGRFEFNEHGLVVIGNPTIEDWRSEYRQCKRQAQGFYRKLGDLLVYGELTYGDLIGQESDESDCDDPVFNAGTLYNAKYVSSRWWPPERRTYNLPWSFYQETSPLKPHQQEALMQQAESEGWTRDRIRQAVAGYQQMNSKREYVPTRPADIIAEQQRELDQAREELDQVRRSHAAGDSVPGPEFLPGPIAKLIRGIAGYLQGREYKAVIIHADDGRVEWIPRDI